ncbi:MAG: nucleoside/nucleotide kinase family protein [Nocardioidaceae bacterium]
MARPSTRETARTLLPHVLRRLRADRSRFLLGICGPPGVGKSSLAEALVEEFEATQEPDTAVVVALDGFHLRQAELERRGQAHIKGAPETFDAAGFVDLLERLRRSQRVLVPRFDRALEEPVADAVAVDHRHRLVIVEGNYLLHDGAWAPVRQLLDEVWQLNLPADLRVAALIARHVRHGRSPDAAQKWVHRSDEANAQLILAAAARAHASVDLLTGELLGGDVLRDGVPSGDLSA